MGPLWYKSDLKQTEKTTTLDPTISPFSHHPELQNLISDPTKSSFRSFDAHAAFSQRPDLDWVIELLSTQSQRDLSRKRALAGKTDADIWVFAYGSLMWDPALRFSEVRRAHVPGYERHFILKDIYGGRGTRQAPGLMAALDHGDGCEGLVFRVTKEVLETEMEILWRREMIGDGYLPTFVTAMIADQPVEALTFVADHQADSICADVTRQEQIEFFSRGSGFLGTSLEYLENIVRQFEALGIVDDACSTLLADVHASSRLSNTIAAGSDENVKGPLV